MANFTSNELFLIVLSIISMVLIFPFLNTYNSIVISAIAIIGYSFNKNSIYSIAIALILAHIVISLTNSRPITEGFEGQTKSKSKKTKNNSKSKKSNNKNSGVASEKFTSDTGDEGEEYFLDTKASFMDVYKSMTPKQLQGLNKDTQNLISTQKQLIETLNNMGPALKDGKQILDTFKNYFGQDNQLSKMMKDL
jgi:hypothetical protein